MIMATSDNPEGTRIAGSAAASGTAQFRILARKCRMRGRAYVTVGEMCDQLNCLDCAVKWMVEFLAGQVPSSAPELLGPNGRATYLVHD
jgi:hypothetical protein